GHDIALVFAPSLEHIEKPSNTSQNMSPKYMSLFLLVILGMAFLATTSLADRRFLSVEDGHDHHHHHPPKKHWPPTTQNEPSNVENKENTEVEDGHDHHHHYPPKKHWPPTTQNEPSKVENKDGHYKPPHKKHPPSGN
ncbi:hypothetical protein glysoja_022901, partial [Glycine soja]